MRKHSEKSNDNLRVINEKFDKQNEKFEEARRETNENNKLLSEKLDKHKEEVTQQVAEQIIQTVSYTHLDVYKRQS